MNNNNDDENSPPPSKSWSIYTRKEITKKYKIHERIGSGAYSDVYRATRLSDSLTVALKEIHDYTSSFREIEALNTLKGAPNVVLLYEYFWSDDEDAVLVLEYLPTDLNAVIKCGKKEWDGGLSLGEVKKWMVQILVGIESVHRSWIVHRDLKPSNLLVSSDGVLKIADFGQARILIPHADDGEYDQSHQGLNQEDVSQPPKGIHVLDDQLSREHREHATIGDTPNDINKAMITRDGATCSMSEQENHDRHSDSYQGEESENEDNAPLTSFVGTRWFRAPELLFGSTNYAQEIDLWSIGCIFAELLSLEPIFPGTSDIDQLHRIFSVLGNLTKEVWPDCVHLPDFNIINFEKVERPIGLEACLPNRSPGEVSLVRRLLCFDPPSRPTAVELLEDNYFNEEPLPVQLSELRVPSKHGDQYEDSSEEWNNNREFDWESDSDDFGPSQMTTTENGFSIRFS